MSKINETNYPRRTQASYEDTDMLVIQKSGGNTYTTRIEDLREDCQETLAPALNTMRENLATIEGSTASKAYAKGDYLVFGGRLCKAITSIAVNATLILDTNIELAPVGDELSSISSDLANKQNLVISVDSTTVNLGNLSAGQSGYGTFTVNIPSGYKTTGFSVPKKVHPGLGHAFSVMVAIGGNKTGNSVSGDYTYQAIGSVASNSADFYALVECVKV